jgi:hypothetical protein
MAHATRDAIRYRPTAGAYNNLGQSPAQLGSAAGPATRTAARSRRCA